MFNDKIQMWVYGSIRLNHLAWDLALVLWLSQK
jgi:hypothetical protein